ncbi:hypothetical protein ACT691_10255 [Vibrio metschnikovii]
MSWTWCCTLNYTNVIKWISQQVPREEWSGALPLLKDLISEKPTEIVADAYELWQ